MERIYQFLQLPSSPARVNSEWVLEEIEIVSACRVRGYAANSPPAISLRAHVPQDFY